MFTQIAHLVRIGEAIVANLQHGPVIDRRSSGVLFFVGIADYHGPNPPEFPVIMDLNDVVFVKRKALLVEKARPPVNKLWVLRLNVCVEEGMVLRGPNPVSQRLNQGDWCLIHRLCITIRHPALDGRPTNTDGYRDLLDTRLTIPLPPGSKQLAASSRLDNSINN